jgi:hypothetical protein
LQRVAAGAGVRVHQPIRLLLEVHVPKHRREHGVLEHIGMVAGVKGVAVGEHRQ